MRNQRRHFGGRFHAFAAPTPLGFPHSLDLVDPVFVAVDGGVQEHGLVTGQVAFALAVAGDVGDLSRVAVQPNGDAGAGVIARVPVSTEIAHAHAGVLRKVEKKSALISMRKQKNTKNEVCDESFKNISYTFRFNNRVEIVKEEFRT